MSGGSEYESLPCTSVPLVSGVFTAKVKQHGNSLPGELRNYATFNRKTNYRPFSLTSFNCPYTNTEIRLLSSFKNYNYMRFNIDISTL